MSDHYYLRHRGRVSGPLPEEKLKALARKGQLSRMHELSLDGTDWFPARELETLFSPKAAAIEEPVLEPLAGPGLETSNWYYTLGGHKLGPVSWGQLQSQVESGEVSGTTLLWRQGMNDWLPAKDVLESLRGGSVKRRHSWLKVALACAAVLALIGGVFAAAHYLKAKPFITSPDDPRLGDAVVVVLQGYEVNTLKGPIFLQLGHGTGFVTSSDGLIFTNRHVVSFDDPETIAVREFLDANDATYVQDFKVLVGKSFVKASVIHTNRPGECDFACLRVERTVPLPYFRVSRSEPPHRRDAVIALGYPGIQMPAPKITSLDDLLSTNVDATFDYFIDRRNETVGFISNVSEKDGAKWLIHGAAISPGNSGGPLIDSEGVVVGINTLVGGVPVAMPDGTVGDAITPGENYAFWTGEIVEAVEKRFPKVVTWK